MVKQIVEQPLPERTLDSLPFWEGLTKGRLLYQRCTGCGRAVWRPRCVCPTCTSDQLDWQESKGNGAIYSYSIVRRPPYQYWADKVPYSVGLIGLDEGYFFFSTIEFSEEKMNWLSEYSVSNLDKIKKTIGTRVQAEICKIGEVDLVKFIPN